MFDILLQEVLKVKENEKDMKKAHRLIFIYYLEKISHGKILEETELQRILR